MRFGISSSWLVVCGLALSCGTTRQRPTKPPAPEATTSGAPVRKVARIVREYPHSPEAFTQGLVFHQGRLFESTGHQGTLRELSLTRAEPVWIESLGGMFAEGLASDGERLYQLTWTEGTLFTWRGLPPVRESTTRYSGDGWGLCYWQGRLVRSDGSPTLTFHTTRGFQPVGSVTVTLAGQPLDQLNELECAHGVIYANIWFTDDVVEIDPTTGQVIAVIDASALRRAVASRLHNPEAVLNGIAVEPLTGRMFLTGKLWPALFEVRLDVVE